MSIKSNSEGRVKSIKSQFENLNKLKLVSTQSVESKKLPKPYVFRRSQTSIDLTKNSTNWTQNYVNNAKKTTPICDSSSIKHEENVFRKETVKSLKDNDHKSIIRQTSNDSDKRGNIKRSPAFRLSQAKNKCLISKFTFNSSADNSNNNQNLMNIDSEHITKDVLSNTLKAALKQPLPTGPPPKKPPRLFELHSNNINHRNLLKNNKTSQTINNKNSPENKRTENSREIKANIELLDKNIVQQAKNKTNLKDTVSLISHNFNCISCTTPIYDTVITDFEDSQLCNIDNDNYYNASKQEVKTIQSPIEHIYMEPFGHLNMITNTNNTKEASDISKFAHRDIKDNLNSNCPEQHTEHEDLHYLCTSVSNSVTSENDTASMDSDPPISITNTYDEINILLNAAFEDKTISRNQSSNDNKTHNQSVPVTKASVRLSRSLTEKRKNYVRQVSVKSKIDTSGYGTLHQTFKSPIFKTFSVEPENDISPIICESTSKRIMKYQQLVETTNNNFSLKTKSSNFNRISEVQSKKPHETINDNSDINSFNLFQACLLVGCNISNGTAYIKSTFPAKPNVPQNIEQLIFPSNDIMHLGKNNQNYSLVLTDETGCQIYGYCRRVVPENCEISLPLVYCLISNTKAPGFYFKILKEIESRHGQSDTQLQMLLKDLQRQPMPAAGKYLHLKLSLASKPTTVLKSNNKILSKRLSLETNPKWLTESAAHAAFHDSVSNTNEKLEKKPGLMSLVQEFDQMKQEKIPYDLGLINRSLFTSHKEVKLDEILIRRPSDLRLESTEISDLYQKLGPELLINVFASLLLERKVILFSKNMSILSSCVLGLQTILYPFQWQYTLVTLVPQNLIEICQAPFPVVVGILDNITIDIEDGLIVDLDKQQMIQTCGDETTILPNALRDSLLVSLEMVDLLDQGKMLSSVLIAEAFLRFFVELFAGYTNIKFEKEAFIESHSSPSVCLFLEWFVETAMFQHFMNSRYLDTTTDTEKTWYTLFNARLLEKSENITKNNQNIESIMKNCRIINKKTKTFKDRFRNFLSNSN